MYEIFGIGFDGLIFWRLNVSMVQTKGSSLLLGML
jgi:hypothetical protein